MQSFSVKQKSCGNECKGSQECKSFANRPKKFSGECKSFANRCSFIGECKILRMNAKVLRGNQKSILGRKSNNYSPGNAEDLRTDAKFLGGKQKFCELTDFLWEMQKFCKQFLRRKGRMNTRFSEEIKSFANEQNVSQGNAEVLRTDTKFLAGTQKFCELMQSFSGGSNFTNERKVSKGDSNVLRTNAKFLGGMQKFFFSITMSLKGSDISCNCNERCTLSCS